ncbi:hypothetical protein BDZ94DRAFT_1311603 [Collybia nuda]|uniref:DUF1996 domain-containing protein n=1 Tax=Collybia nuda TaxID=64659 RepID=A0A9P5Y106_9AGAR|nr:hypothetical protein BDZ94DRAFT_1311603 [Collybia nuda]
MARHAVKALALLSAISSANAYWLMGIENFITTERLDPIVSPGGVSGHVHSVLGGSNFRSTTNTAMLRESECTSIPIAEDKSSYWFPHLYFQWANGSFTSLNGGAVISLGDFQDYFFDDKPGTTTEFPDNFRMISGNPTVRSYDPKSHEQSAVTFLCLDFNGVTTEHNSLPLKACPSGIRAQINFQSCWDGKNVDSPDHKSHVAYRSEGADKGSCKDPKFPVTLPRIFIELYWGSNEYDKYRSQAMNTTQPFVYSYGDRTGYGNHADFINGWDKGVLQKAIDGCTCNIYGDPNCCAQKGIFTLTKGKKCRITRTVDEVVTGTIPRLPGNNPVQEEGPRATMYQDLITPGILSPVYVYTSGNPPPPGKLVTPPSTAVNSLAPSPSVIATSQIESSTVVIPGSSSAPVTSASASTKPPATTETASASTVTSARGSPPAVSPTTIAVSKSSSRLGTVTPPEQTPTITKVNSPAVSATIVPSSHVGGVTSRVINPSSSPSSMATSSQTKEYIYRTVTVTVTRSAENVEKTCVERPRQNLHKGYRHKNLNRIHHSHNA